MVISSTRTTADFQALREAVAAKLSDSDDPNCWNAIIETVLADGAHVCSITDSRKLNVFTEIGACSHWLRPHQYRWTADGGFAMPVGYGGSGWSRLGLPEFDWSMAAQWDDRSSDWKPVERVKGKRPLVLRVAIPTRTAIHEQAAVHTIWTPGAPTSPSEKVLQLYGFRRHNDIWECTAYSSTGGAEGIYRRR